MSPKIHVNLETVISLTKLLQGCHTVNDNLLMVQELGPQHLQF